MPKLLDVHSIFLVPIDRRAAESGNFKINTRIKSDLGLDNFTFVAAGINCRKTWELGPDSVLQVSHKEMDYG